MTLSKEQLQRYARHLSLPEVGVEGQERLADASMLIIGAGGLGSPAALYLAAAGVGRLGLVDFDTVDLSNLQRQVLHDSHGVGSSKLDSARDRLQALNPGVRIDTHATRLTSANALDLLGGYDVIIDGTDNFPTRYLVNDACVFLNKPNVYGSVFRFEGQASVFHPPQGPCYRCLYPEPPPPGLVPSCEEGGVLGVVPGLVGMIQATEALKLVLGKGETLVGRLLVVDVLEMKFRQMRLPRNPSCVVCGENPTIRQLIDYEHFCGIVETTPEDSMVIEPAELRVRMASKRPPRLVDVRESWEWDAGRIDWAEHLPLRELPSRWEELDRQEEIVFYCATGARSGRATQMAREAGFSRTRNLAGGIRRWLQEKE